MTLETEKYLGDGFLIFLAIIIACGVYFATRSIK